MSPLFRIGLVCHLFPTLVRFLTSALVWRWAGGQRMVAETCRGKQGGGWSRSGRATNVAAVSCKQDFYSQRTEVSSVGTAESEHMSQPRNLKQRNALSPDCPQATVSHPSRNPLKGHPGTGMAWGSSRSWLLGALEGSLLSLPRPHWEGQDSTRQLGRG